MNLEGDPRTVDDLRAHFIGLVTALDIDHKGTRRTAEAHEGSSSGAKQQAEEVS